MPVNNTQRIAKNTVILYFRMFVMMAIGLYISSVMHNVLGLEDFDTYNIIDSGEEILNTLVFLDSSLV